MKAAEFRFRPLTPEDAAAIRAWRYPPPFNFYNHTLASDTALTDLLRPEHNYHAILNGAGELIAFFCFGPDARIAGGEYENNAIDIGMGVAPQFLRQGIGGICFRAVIRHLHTREGADRAMRATVVAWNRRAIRLCLGMGFQEAASFRSPVGIWFKVLVRNPGSAAPCDGGPGPN